MKKKGISPLIATVLILGFTVALAAVIMTWGTGFTKRMQTQTEETANVQVICATDVVFDVKSACWDATAGQYKILIQNDGKEKLWKWRMRLYKDETSVDSHKLDDTTRYSIDPFGIEQLLVTPGTGYENLIKKIEAIPVIQKSGVDVVCSQNVDSYGDASTTASVIPACT